MQLESKTGASNLSPSHATGPSNLGQAGKVSSREDLLTDEVSALPGSIEDPHYIWLHHVESKNINVSSTDCKFWNGTENFTSPACRSHSAHLERKWPGWPLSLQASGTHRRPRNSQANSRDQQLRSSLHSPGECQIDDCSKAIPPFHAHQHWKTWKQDMKTSVEFVEPSFCFGKELWTKLGLS